MDIGGRRCGTPFRAPLSQDVLVIGAPSSPLGQGVLLSLFDSPRRIFELLVQPDLGSCLEVEHSLEIHLAKYAVRFTCKGEYTVQ